MRQQTNYRTIREIICLWSLIAAVVFSGYGAASLPDRRASEYTEVETRALRRLNSGPGSMLKVGSLCEVF